MIMELDNALQMLTSNEATELAKCSYTCGGATCGGTCDVTSWTR